MGIVLYKKATLHRGCQCSNFLTWNILYLYSIDPFKLTFTDSFHFQEDSAPLTKNWHVLCTVSKLSTSFWKIIYASCSKLSKELKNDTEILVGQAVFKLWIKTAKILFWSITQEPLDLLKFQCYFFYFLG